MSQPTMQGTAPGTEAARYTLAEIDALCGKAARGVGCPWGLAEEAGKAARWLAARGLPGPEALAALLEGARDCPCSGRGGGPECALRFGARLADRVERIAAGEPVSGVVAQPLLVLAQLGRAATATASTFTVDWSGVRAHCGPAGLSIAANGDLLPASTSLRCRAGRAELPEAPAEHRSRPVAASAWAMLERYAARTYAPATEASRQAGAGAGTVDND